MHNAKEVDGRHRKLQELGLFCFCVSTVLLDLTYSKLVRPHGKQRGERPNQKRMRNYLLHNIKRRHTYDTTEIAALLDVDRKSIQRWMKLGLKPIMPNKKPLLFDGQALYDFIKMMRADRKVPLGEDEFFCLSCKGAVKAKQGTERLEKTGKRIGKKNREQYSKTGCCEVCGGKISRLLKPFSKGLMDSQ